MIKLDFYKNLYDVELVGPNTIKAKKAETDVDYEFFELSKSIIKALYSSEGPLEMSYKTSQNLYEEVDREYWKKYVKEKLDSKGFDLGKYTYIGTSQVLLELINPDNQTLLEEVKMKYEKAVKELFEIPDASLKETFDLDNLLEKVIITCDSTDNFENVIIIEMDYRNSKYSLIPGIIVDKSLWLHSKKSLDENYISQFYTKIDLKDEINLANKFGEALYRDYKYDEELADDELSLGELFAVLKQSGINIIYEKERSSAEYGQVLELSGIDEGSIIGSDIIMSINSYDTPFKALKKLLSLEKSFKETSISFKKILSFLFQEYFNLEVGISVNDLISMRNKITKHKGDFKIIKTEVKKLNN